MMKRVMRWHDFELRARSKAGRLVTLSQGLATMPWAKIAASHQYA